MIVPVTQDFTSVQHTKTLQVLSGTYAHSMEPRGMNQVISGGTHQQEGNGGDVPSRTPDGGSSSASQSPSGQHSSSNAATKIVIPLFVALALACFFGVAIYLIMRFRRSVRTRRASAMSPPIVSEKPQLFEVQLETPSAVHPVNARWNHIKPLSAKYIPQDIYDLEQAVAGRLPSYPSTPATSRPVSTQTSSSHSSFSSKGSRGAPKTEDDGRLRVAVTIAMPSRRTEATEKETRGNEVAPEEPPPLYLGVADIPWQATKLEVS